MTPPAGPAGPPADLGPDEAARLDGTPDEMFYGMPRLVTHIDDAACAALARYYATILREGDAVLDLMSSCVSHLPPAPRLARVTGHGMNRTELEANPQLTDYFLQNLNRTPALPLETGSYRACLMAVSVQYLVRPVTVFAEIGRVLAPGGAVAVSFSNRMFPTKAIAAWRAGDDRGRAALVTDYLARAGAFTDIRCLDLSPAPGRSDPLFVVEARTVNPPESGRQSST